MSITVPMVKACSPALCYGEVLRGGTSQEIFRLLGDGCVLKRNGGTLLSYTFSLLP